MLHLEAIIERNKRPPAQSQRFDGDIHVVLAAHALERADRVRRQPWDKPDPLPEDEAHPR